MLDTIQQIIAIIAALAGLISTGIGAFITIKTLIKARTEKTLQENWELIKTMAMTAMSKAEESGKAASIKLDSFIDQLMALIDQSIELANTIKNKK